MTLEQQMFDDITDARDLFETEVENGNWPEKWDSGIGWDFLIKYLLERGWHK
jgi:hypothetical protein